MNSVRTEAAGPTAATKIPVTQHPVPGGWTEQAVTLADRTFYLYLPAEPDRFLDHLAEESEPTSDAQPDSQQTPTWPDPYWAKLWPMAIELAAQVYAADWPAGTRVIEIGCGCGLPGIAAAARGWDVTFSDYVPLALELAADNARRNGCEAKALFLDWRRPEKHAFDVILASEVLYDRALHGAVLDTVAAILNPGGFIWASDPGRSATEEFIPRAAAAGWSVDIRTKDGELVPRLQFNQFNRLEIRRSAS